MAFIRRTKTKRKISRKTSSPHSRITKVKKKGPRGLRSH
jgi:hypothetical protein